MRRSLKALRELADKQLADSDGVCIRWQLWRSADGEFDCPEWADIRFIASCI